MDQQDNKNRYENNSFNLKESFLDRNDDSLNDIMGYKRTNKNYRKVFVPGYG